MKKFLMSKYCDTVCFAAAVIGGIIFGASWMLGKVARIYG